MRAHKNRLFSYTVIFEAAEEGGYAASVPALPGCYSQGETIEETESNIKEAILIYIESLLAHKEEVPKEKRILQGKVEVTLNA